MGCETNFSDDPSLANDNVCQQMLTWVVCVLIKSRVRSPFKYRHPIFVDIDFTCDHFCITQGETSHSS